MTETPSSRPSRFSLFRPILAGATLRERLIGIVGAVVAVIVTGLISAAALGGAGPLIAAPVGASALLLFIVPTSPLTQPWQIIGGNVLSALVGVIVADLVPEPHLASGLAVGLAIAVMSGLRCLHPPGAAAALFAVVGGPAVTAAGFAYPFVPIGLNAVVLVLVGIVLHRATGQRYPHRPVPAKAVVPTAPARVGFIPADVDSALQRMGETFDIDRADLDQLLRQVELEALAREDASLAEADRSRASGRD